ncbi:MAG: InlB B-repeat-containing protein [Bifidobacteriaceae bacterium]|nr:InlB B-repeat-containing protein [Bifidobacteriaceae bacterium]
MKNLLGTGNTPDGGGKTLLAPPPPLKLGAAMKRGKVIFAFFVAAALSLSGAIVGTGVAEAATVDTPPEVTSVKAVQSKTQGKIDVTFAAKNHSSFEVTVTDSNGKAVYPAKSLAATAKTISVTNLKPSNYTVRVIAIRAANLKSDNYYDRTERRDTVTKQVKVTLKQKKSDYSKKYSDLGGLAKDRVSAIRWMYRYGVAASAKTYNPKGSVNRGAMAQFMHKLVGSIKSTNKTVSPKDISKLAKDRKADVTWLATEGITVLASGSKYNPTGVVNRGAMAEFMYKLAGSQGTMSTNVKSKNYHPDAAALTVEATKVKKDKALTKLKKSNPNRYYAVLWLVKNNITVIGKDGKYNPGGVVNRGAMAQFMQKLYNNVLIGTSAKPKTVAPVKFTINGSAVSKVDLGHVNSSNQDNDYYGYTSECVAWGPEDDWGDADCTKYVYTYTWTPKNWGSCTYSVDGKKYTALKANQRTIFLSKPTNTLYFKGDCRDKDGTINSLFYNAIKSSQVTLSGNVLSILGGKAVNTVDGMFTGAFAYNGLTSIPATFFEGVSGAPTVGLFSGTFSGNPILSIPPTIFKTVKGAPQASAFYNTFYGSKATAITADLFSRIQGTPAPGAFAGTFESSSLKAIPATLFSGIKGKPADGLFNSTFYGTNITSIPAGLFSGIKGAPAPYMFYETFAYNSGLTAIPAKLFSGIKGAPADSMFAGTFIASRSRSYTLNPTNPTLERTEVITYNTGVTAIPAGLFSGISGKPANNMFSSTFEGQGKVKSVGDLGMNITGPTGYQDKAETVYVYGSYSGMFYDVGADTSVKTLASAAPINIFTNKPAAAVNTLPKLDPVSSNNNAFGGQDDKVGWSKYSGYNSIPRSWGGLAKTFTIKFDSTGGSAVSSYSAKEGNYVDIYRENPTKSGFRFAGWWTAATGGSEVGNYWESEWEYYTSSLTASITLYAHWTTSPVITLNLDYAGATEPYTTIPLDRPYGYTYLDNLAAPTREGFTFDGWYTESGTDGSLITEWPNSYGAATLYAHWIEIAVDSDSDAQSIEPEESVTPAPEVPAEETPLPEPTETPEADAPEEVVE